MKKKTSVTKKENCYFDEENQIIKLTAENTVTPFLKY